MYLNLLCWDQFINVPFIMLKKDKISVNIIKDTKIIHMDRYIISSMDYYSIVLSSYEIKQYKKQHRYTLKFIILIYYINMIKKIKKEDEGVVHQKVFKALKIK